MRPPAGTWASPWTPIKKQKMRPIKSVTFSVSLVHYFRVFQKPTPFGIEPKKEAET
jgi:hypothetical protein